MKDIEESISQPPTTMWMSRALGGVVLAVSLAVMMAWWVGNESFITVFTQSAPMQFNAALSLFLLAGSILLATWQFDRLAWIGFGVTMLIAGATLIQYLAGISLGIDTLLSPAREFERTTHTNRMSPATAVDLTILAGAGMLMLLSHRRRRWTLFVACLGALAASIAAVNSAGYLFGTISSASWQFFSGMAIHTGLGCLLISFCLLLDAWQMEKHREGGMPRWTAPLVGIGCVAVVVASWLQGLAGSEQAIRRQMNGAAERYAQTIESELRSRTEGLQRMGRRWMTLKEADVESRQSDALSYLLDANSLLAIQWLDAEGRVQWIVPIQGNEHAVGLNMASDPFRRPALLRAQETGTTVRTQPLSLKQADRGFLSFAAVQRDGKHQGTIVGVFRFRDMIESALSVEPKDRYRVRVEVGGEVVYEGGAEQVAPVNPRIWVGATSFGEEGDRWVVNLLPTQVVVQSIRGGAHGGVLLGGILLSFFITVTIRLLQRARQQTDRVEVSHGQLVELNRSLDAHVLDRTRALNESRIAALNIAQDAEEARKQSDAIAKELEAANEQLKERTAELEQFLYTASHDLKTPIVSMVGLISLLQDSIRKEQFEDTGLLIGRVSQSAEQLGHVINDLILFSQIGRTTAAAEPVNLHRLLSHCEDRLRAAYPKATWELSVRKAWPVLNIDRRHMAGLIEQLLGNAVLHGCTKASNRIEVGWKQADGQVQIYIRDFGPGIDPKFHERIFGLFQRLQTDTRGTGVGLAIANRLVRMHGGQIRVESSSGKGATFWIILPDDLLVAGEGADGKVDESDHAENTQVPAG